MNNNNRMIPIFDLDNKEITGVIMNLQENKTLFRILEGMQKLYPRITVHQTMLLFAIHQNDGETQAVIARKAGMLPTTTSKHMKMYADQNIYKKPGFGFITMRQDPLNNNYNIIELTEKGKQFIENL